MNQNTNTDVIVAGIAAIGALFSTFFQYGNIQTQNTIYILSVLIVGSAVVYIILSKRKFPQNLLNHAIFQVIQSRKFYIQKNFELRNPVKTEVFKDILNNVLNIYDKHIRNFILRSESIKSESELKSVLLYYINEIVIDISDYYMRNDTLYSQEDKQTLFIIVNKFLKSHAPQIHSTKDLCVEVIDTAWYAKDITEKVSIILLLFQKLIIDMTTDTKRIADKMNGDLNGKKFRNRLIR